MRALFPNRWGIGAVAALALAAPAAYGQAQPSEPAPVVLDRVVAVVNNQPILSSDLDDEIRFSILEPQANFSESITPQRALQTIISRTLIQQQIRQEDATAAQASGEEIQARVNQLRKDLPACVRMDCTTDAGWQKFLSTYGLTVGQVETRLGLRIELLRFIEIRFRQGIRIPQQDIETYYRDQLVPKYAKGAAVPPLKEVAPRIEEVLLEEQVNNLFDTWLENLRQQGDVEILDPSLETGTTKTSAKDTAP